MKHLDKKTLQLEFEDNDKGEEYEVEAICNSTVYIKELESRRILGLYYLISWKDFPEDKNTSKLALIIQYLKRLVNTSHQKHPNKPTTTPTTVDIPLPTAWLTVKPQAQSNK